MGRILARPRDERHGHHDDKQDQPCEGPRTPSGRGAHLHLLILVRFFAVVASLSPFSRLPLSSPNRRLPPLTVGLSLPAAVSQFPRVPFWRYLMPPTYTYSQRTESNRSGDSNTWNMIRGPPFPLPDLVPHVREERFWAKHCLPRTSW